MVWRFHGAQMHLEEGKEYFSLEKAREEINTAWLYDKTGNSKGKSGVDERVDELHALNLEALSGPHIGDCTCCPSSCSKCHVESLLGTDTIEGLGKHEAHSIEGAFSKGRSIEQAIEHLRTYDADKAADAAPESWKFKNRDTWNSALPRWRAEQANALEWLKKYRDEHFLGAVNAPELREVAG